MKTLDMGSTDSIILDVFCQKMAQLQESGKLINVCDTVIVCMLSIHMAIGNREANNFWEPLFEILALSLEQKLLEDHEFKIDL